MDAYDRTNGCTLTRASSVPGRSISSSDRWWSSAIASSASLRESGDDLARSPYEIVGPTSEIVIRMRRAFSLMSCQLSWKSFENKSPSPSSSRDANEDIGIPFWIRLPTHLAAKGFPLIRDRRFESMISLLSLSFLPASRQISRQISLSLKGLISYLYGLIWVSRYLRDVYSRYKWSDSELMSSIISTSESSMLSRISKARRDPSSSLNSLIFSSRFFAAGIASLCRNLASGCMISDSFVHRAAFAVA